MGSEVVDEMVSEGSTLSDVIVEGIVWLSVGLEELVGFKVERGKKEVRNSVEVVVHVVPVFGKSVVDSEVQVGGLVVG